MGRFKVAATPALYDQHSTPTKNFPSKGKSITFKGAVALWTIWAKGCSTLIWTTLLLNWMSLSACRKDRIRESCANTEPKVFVGQLQIVCAYLSMRLLKVRGKWSCWLVYVTYHEEYGRRTIIFPGETSASGSWRDRGQAISSTLHLNTLLITDQKLISGTVQKKNLRAKREWMSKVLKKS